MAIGLQGGAESDGAGMKMRSEITYRARLRGFRLLRLALIRLEPLVGPQHNRTDDGKNQQRQKLPLSTLRPHAAPRLSRASYVHRCLYWCCCVLRKDTHTRGQRGKEG